MQRPTAPVHNGLYARVTRPRAKHTRADYNRDGTRARFSERGENAVNVRWNDKRKREEFTDTPVIAWRCLTLIRPAGRSWNACDDGILFSRRRTIALFLAEPIY